MSNKPFLENEITAVEAQLKAVREEVNKLKLQPPPVQVLGSLKSLGENIQKLRSARDNGNALGVYKTGLDDARR
jgi:hypothetical protein